MATPSVTACGALAERCILQQHHQHGAAASSPSPCGAPGGPVALPPASPSVAGVPTSQAPAAASGVPSAAALRAPAPAPSQPAGPLLSTLIDILSEGQPHSVLVLACLTYLTCAPKAAAYMGGAGLVPLLVGMLKNGRHLEAQLVAGCLGLLAGVVTADAQQRVLLANLRGVAAIVAMFLSCGESSWRRLALQLLQEMLLCKQGILQARSSPAIAAALDTAAAAEAGLGEDASWPFVEARRLLEVLPRVMAAEGS